jgi:RNA polymerase sigma-54 factor
MYSCFHHTQVVFVDLLYQGLSFLKVIKELVFHSPMGKIHLILNDSATKKLYLHVLKLIKQNRFDKHMLKQQLQQRLQQRLSPQQIQLIRLLELPAIELEERIKHELEENPALDEGRDAESEDNSLDAATPTESVEEIVLGDYLTEDDIPDYKLHEISNRPEKKEDIPFSVGESLNEFLMEQLGLRELSESERVIAEYIIGSIDDDGYLRRPLQAISDDLLFQAGEEVSESAINQTLAIIQDFEPSGIAARSLQECLSIQLNKRAQTPQKMLAIKVLTDYFEEFSKKHYDKILKGLNITEDTLKQIIREITTLNPKPGSSWGNELDTVMSQVIPDFIVEELGGELILSMNNGNLPDMHINRSYAEMLQDYAGNKLNQTSDMKEAVQFVKQKLDSAQWFIDAVRQRQETLRRTMETIIILQKDFFLTGDETMLRPMILKDVASRTGYDISTISRVSSSKYVQTNFGIYSLKYFFSEATQTDSGEEISTREVKQILKEQINQEDKRKPLTDEELATILKEKGYVIARRTVAKYREQIGVPVARLRKEI